MFMINDYPAVIPYVNSYYANIIYFILYICIAE